RATVPVQRLAGRPVAAFCGIGNPGAFRHTLTRLGAAPAAFRTFRDHHPYTRADVEDVRTWAEQLAAECVVVTTQKDLVKLRLTRIGGREPWAPPGQPPLPAGAGAPGPKIRAGAGRRAQGA